MILTPILIALVGVLILLAGLIIAIGRAFDQVEGGEDEDVDWDALRAYAIWDAGETVRLFTDRPGVQLGNPNIQTNTFNEYP